MTFIPIERTLSDESLQRFSEMLTYELGRKIVVSRSSQEDQGNFFVSIPLTTFVNFTRFEEPAEQVMFLLEQARLLERFVPINEFSFDSFKVSLNAINDCPYGGRSYKLAVNYCGKLPIR